MLACQAEVFSPNLKMFFGVSAPRTTFQVLFIGIRLFFTPECDGSFDIPRSKDSRVRYFSGIVALQPFREILRDSCVVVLACGDISQDVDVVKGAVGH